MKKIFLLFFILLFTGKLFAAGINEIVFFGDSLSDDGNLYNLLKVIPRSPPYYQGRFSNGPTWAELLGKHYQDQYTLPYNVYAYGGATVLDQEPNDRFYTPMNLKGELDQFFENTHSSDKSTKLYVIWIGANDYLMDEQTDPETLTTQVVAQISKGITDLMNHGAKYFMIMNLPDLSIPPYATTNHLEERLHLLSAMHNSKLAKVTENFQQANPNAKFISIDIYGILNDLLKDPQKFNKKYSANLTVLTRACWQGTVSLKQPALSAEASLRNDLQKTIDQLNPALTGQYNTQALAERLLKSPQLREAYLTGRMAEDDLKPCQHPEQYVFWDFLHPSAILHELLSKMISETLDKEAKDLFTH